MLPGFHVRLTHHIRSRSGLIDLHEVDVVLEFALECVNGLAQVRHGALRPSWTRIVVRVAGSWVAAVGMLMFGWLVRGAP